MHHYRADIIGHDGHMASFVDLQCDNDEDAKERAQQLGRVLINRA
jgi:hypothetical protein